MQQAMKSALDRIVVKTNARMSELIDWYMANKEYLESQPFQRPFLQGLVCLEEENIDFSFESHSDSEVLIKIYPARKEVIMVAFRYDFESDVITGREWDKRLPENKRRMLEIIEMQDKTCKKEAFKYRVLMYYAAYYRNEVVVDEKSAKRMDKHTRRSLKKKGTGPVPLVRNTYVVMPKEESLKKPANPEKKRHYEKPDHEVKVRGYRRKNGTWVAPYSRYKDKGEDGPKTYKA